MRSLEGGREREKREGEAFERGDLGHEEEEEATNADSVLSFILAHYITSFLRTELRVTQRKLLRHHDTQ